jgi:hypothetical protein
MILTRTDTDFYVYSSDYAGDITGELQEQGTLEQIKNKVFDLLKTTPLPSFPVQVTEVTDIEKPQNTVLLIEIEASKAYRIKPIFDGSKFLTIKKTWAGGLLNIIAFVENLVNE